ncbi:MAG TPA: PKD domain-containing protein [Chitinophagaceae bacterium]|jgi:hypothetical protein
MKTQYQKASIGFIPLFVALMAFNALPSAAQGKRVSVGTGSGSIEYPTAQATLNLQDGDTLVINGGTYQDMNISNITASPGKRIYVINNGLVEITQSWGAFNFSYLTNVTIEGDGTPGIPYGFYIHDVGWRAMLIPGRLTSTYLSYFRIENIPDYGIYMIDTSLVYTGNNSGLFYDLKFLNFKIYNIAQTPFQLGDWSHNYETGLVSMIRKIEIAYCDIEQVPGNGEIIHLNKTVNANVHHNIILHTGMNDTRHTGIVYLRGNGDVHHNYISDHWGNACRGQGFGLDSIGTINFYNNVVLNSNKYSAMECNSFDGDINNSPYTRVCNYKMYNNTVGNAGPGDWQAHMAETYNAFGGTIEIKNNLGFNIQKGLPYDPTYNYIYYQLNVTIPDTANNLYNASYVPLGLVNDSSCLLNVNSPAIDKGQNFGFITDDIDGVPRPQNGIFDIGAHEYKSGVIYPVSNAGTNINLVLPADSTVLNGSASYNPGGGVLQYAWSVVSGPSTFFFAGDTTATPTFSQLVVGTYQVKLVVTNSSGLTNNSTITVTVNATTPPPVANAGSDMTITLPVNSATPDGSASSNPTGGSVSYAWSQIAGPSAATMTGTTAAEPVVSNLVQGIYQFQLTVTNISGISASDTMLVTVNPAPPPGSLPPVANAGVSVTITLPTNSVTLDGSASYEPGGGALTYAWSVVSGPSTYTLNSGTSANPTLTGLVAGSYIINLTVTNTTGLTNSSIVEVTVNPVVKSPSPPVAIPGADTTVSFPNGYAVLNGSASYAVGGAAIVSYAWAQVSGPSNALINNKTSPISAPIKVQPGDYIFQLTVTDNNGLSASAQVKVSVINTFRLDNNKTINVYPNPCTTQLNLHISSDTTGTMLVKVSNAAGAVVFMQESEKPSSQVDLPIPVSGLAAGAYIVEVVIGKQLQLLTRFVKQ